MACAVCSGGQQASHHVQTRVAEHLRILERCRNAALELLFATGQRGDAALAARPIARRRIEQRLRETCIVKTGADIRLVEVIGKKELHALEAILCRSGKAVEERVLLVHHGQVGGKARHDRPLNTIAYLLTSFGGVRNTAMQPSTSTPASAYMPADVLPVMSLSAPII